MKQEEHTRLYSYDSYDLHTGEQIEVEDMTTLPNEAEDEAEDDDEDDDVYTPFEDDIYMNYAISIIDGVSQDIKQHMVGFYFNMMTMYCKWHHEWVKIANTYPLANSVNVLFNYLWKKGERLFCRHRVEPEGGTWVNNVFLYRVKQENNTFVYNINDTYRYNTTTICDASSIQSEMTRCIEKRMLNTLGAAAWTNPPVGVIDIIDHLVIGKYTDDCDAAYYMVATNKCTEDIQRSNVRFMSIEYAHPSMPETIPLELPPGMMICGNVLFTRAFVLRALLYQGEPFVFDMDYTIKMVDESINIFELKSEDFMVLRENAYEVKTDNK